ncbi:MAG: FAD-binding protein [Calditrichaeota bacterium]|nr:FAD-binding protein [Calditrichota bacterium]
MKKISHTCDVLVVGSGGAALRGAIAACEAFPDGHICLATKGGLGRKSVTGSAVSDRMAFHATLPYTEPGGPDNWTFHAKDIFEIGGRVSDGDLAKILAKHSGDALEYLAQLGVPFVKKPDGTFDQFVTDGSDYPRACYTGPETAIEISKALRKKIRELPVEIIENVMIYKLVTADGKIAGAFGLSTKKQDQPVLHVFETPAVLLGTGGAGQVFEQSVFPSGMTGDGYYLAYEAGAKLVNMEFQQIGLCSVETHLACSGSMMRAMPRFITEDGHEFLPDHLPDKSPNELAELVFGKGANWPISAEKANTAIDIAVFREIQNGKRVFLEYSKNPAGFDFDALSPEILEKYSGEVRNGFHSASPATSPLARLKQINPDALAWLKKHGVDLEAGDWLEIAPSIQHFQGGIKIRQQGNTSVPGLFAAGECAGGQHGANRPGGNALMDSQVFGKIAGEAAASLARTGSTPKISPRAVEEEIQSLNAIRSREGVPASRLWAAIRKLAYQYAGVIRTEEGLRSALTQLYVLQAQPIQPDARGLTRYFEVRSIARVAEMIFQSAVLRKESRGPHLFFKTPYDAWPQPAGGKEWEKYLVLWKSGSEMKTEFQKPVALDLGDTDEESQK